MFGMVESLEILKVERRGLSIYIWVYMAMSPLCCGWEKKNVIPENKGRVYGEGPLAEDSRDGHTP